MTAKERKIVEIYSQALKEEMATGNNYYQINAMDAYKDTPIVERVLDKIAKAVGAEKAWIDYTSWGNRITVPCTDEIVYNDIVSSIKCAKANEDFEVDLGEDNYGRRKVKILCEKWEEIEKECGVTVSDPYPSAIGCRWYTDIDWEVAE